MERGVSTPRDRGGVAAAVEDAGRCREEAGPEASGVGGVIGREPGEREGQHEHRQEGRHGGGADRSHGANAARVDRGAPEL
jgi:hypothetical protein